MLWLTSGLDIAYSGPFLSIKGAVRFSENLTHQVLCIGQITTHQMVPDSKKTRRCQVVTGQVKVKLQGEEFSIWLAGESDKLRVESGTKKIGFRSGATWMNGWSDEK